MPRGAAVWCLLVMAGGCADDPKQTVADPDAAPTPRPDAGGEVQTFPKECPDLYAQDLLPVFEIEIDPAEWAGLEYDRTHWEEREAAGENIKPYHPLISFRYGDEVVTDAYIRLKGNPCCSWKQSKLQFVIKFNEVNKDARFHGLRKLDLDAAPGARSLLRNRVALAYLREAGVIAGCANNAKLIVNGMYYGVYANLERIDREFLERHFEDPDGELFKHGWELKTNEETATTEVVERFWDTLDPDELASFVDLDQMIRAWAAEAVIPQADGYWSGSNNFYLYDDPLGKLLFIPHDLDDTFDHMPADQDLLVLRDGGTRREHFDALMADPVWEQRYFDAVADVLAAYDPAQLAAWTDEWAAQIRHAVEADSHKPFTFDEHVAAVATQRAYYAERAAFAGDWQSCQLDNAPDADGDGFGWCRDCDDASDTTHAGAAELCNGVDDDCNGVVDDDPGDTCPDCVPVDGTAFLICTRPRSWAASKARCEAHGAEIAVPLNEEENEQLYEQAQALAEYTALWIGVTDEATEGQWLTVGGEVPAYLPWEPGQPSGAEDSNCMLLNYQFAGMWNDRDCDDAHAVACRVIVAP